MDLNKLRQALAMLNAFTTSLPNGDIEEKYVDLYHKTLDDIRAQTNQDLSYFHIPQTELEHHVTSVRRDPVLRHERGTPNKTYSKERYCDRERFLMSLRGAVNFINSLTIGYGADTLPLIDPPK